MIRLASALIGLRWRLLVNGLRARRRDTLERFSRTFALIVRAAFFLLVFGLAAGLGFLALAGGRRVGAGTTEAGNALIVARLLLFTVLAALVLIPPGGTAQAGITRLLLLPIPRRAFHGIEVLSVLADPRIVVLAPALLLFSAGLTLEGRMGAALVALVDALGILALLVTLGALASFLTSWLMRSRRRGELFTLVFVLVLSVAGMIPAFVGDSWEQWWREDEQPLERLDRGLPSWSRAIPSEVYGRSIALGLAGRAGEAWLGVALLLVETAALYVLSSAVHGRLLGSTERTRARRGSDAVRSLSLRFPGLTPAASAVALVQARNTLRSVRGRLVALLPGPMIALFGLLSRRIPQEFPGGTALGTDGHLLFAAGCAFSLYTLLSFSLNSLATDRAGLTLQLLAPIPDVDLVRGKALGCGILLGASVLNCLLCSLLIAPGGSPLAWLAVLLGAAATYLWLCPVGALFSALLPVASDLNKTGTGGNPHGLAMLLGALLVMIVSGPPGLILHLGRHRPALALLFMALWALVAAALSIPLLGLAARTVGPRRENLALVAQGR